MEEYQKLLREQVESRVAEERRKNEREVMEYEIRRREMLEMEAARAARERDFAAAEERSRRAAMDKDKLNRRGHLRTKELEQEENEKLFQRQNSSADQYV